MCFGGGSNDTTQTTTNRPERDPILDAMKNAAIGHGLNILNQSYPGYDASRRVAGFTPDQRAGFQAVRKYSNSPIDIPNERIVDEGGKLGKISDYMDPYLENALDPSIRDMQEAGDVQRQGIGDQAMSSGAFGDARHGVVEGAQYEGELQQIGDLTSRAYSNAYQTGMGQRASDLDRFTQNALAADQQELNRALSLLGIGDQQQQLGQQRANANYEEYLRGVEWPFRQWDMFTSLLGGTPTASTQTSTTSQPNNWLQTILGSLLGSTFR